MIRVLLIFFIILYSSSAFSQEKKVYAGVQGQLVYSDHEGVASENAQGLANACSCTVSYTFENATLSGRIFAGYQISPKFSVELGYFNTSTIDIEYSGTASGGAWTATQSGQAAGVDFAGNIYLGDEIYLKAGLHNSRVDELASISIAGFTYTATGSSSGTGFLAGGGWIKELSNNKTFLNYDVVYYDSLGGVSDSTAMFFSVGWGMRF